MIDISIVARDLKIPPEQVKKTLQLLDDGNTIPFITRFRKDETGGLNEEQIQAIRQRATSLRALAERKAFVLKSIESQGQLTDQLKAAVDKASTSNSLEDIYLPFKPRKKSRAQEARQKGLGPLAEDIFAGKSPEVDLATRATDYVRVDKGLNSVDEVIQGVSDLLAEKFADDVELRQQLRKIMVDTGKVSSVSTAPPEEPQPNNKTETGSPAEQKSDEANVAPVSDEASVATAPAAETAPVQTEEAAKSGPAEAAAATETPQAESRPDAPQPEATSEPAADATVTGDMPKVDSADTAEATTASESPAAASEEASAAPPADAATTAATTDKPRKKKKKKKKKKADDPFRDYHNFKQPLKKFPHHRVLAINRGERAGKLKARIECDENQIRSTAQAKCIPADHPFADHLKTCLEDSLARLVLPGLEREIRRELTETAETHAVQVFANNLRNLLLQPPIRNRRILAIDPGYKRGCSVAVVDQGGNLLCSDHVFVVGNQARRDEGKQKVASLVKEHNVDIIAIGNGAASRDAEKMISDCITTLLADNSSIRYVMVNEAGASIYSTSEVGREELPDASPAVRSAVSIGRRLQDPMSELVKISPANIGVGMYQHDVKSKHLSESLDGVVQSCVNSVGVNVNTASPSLLRYVSGLNALTARRIVEHRNEQGPFKNRQQLKEVSGFGDATFIQAAGFLRILDGDSPLDSTSIHPESYEVAEKIITMAGATPGTLFPPTPELEVVQRKPAAGPPSPPATQTPAATSEPAEPAKPAETETAAASATATSEPAAATEPVVPAEEAAATVESAAADPASTPTADAQPATEPASEPAMANTAAAPAEPVAAQSPSATPSDSSPQEDSVRSERTRILQEARRQRRDAAEKIKDLDLEKLGAEMSVGQLLIGDVVRAIKRPDWDPREKARKPLFRRGMLKTEELKEGQQLDGQVVNVVDFGVFVDIGLGESCLVHVSHLSNRFIRDPQTAFSVGDVIRTWVSEIDTARRRVKLTAIKPGSERSERPPRRSRRPAKGKDGKEGARSSARGGSRGDRKHGDRKYGDRKYGDRAKTKRPPRKPRKPRPVTPITDSMLKGDEPMRSFSDLIQFVKKKPEDESDKA